MEAALCHLGDHHGEHRPWSQEKQDLGSGCLCVTQMETYNNAPGDALEESTSWLVWGVSQGSPGIADRNQNRRLFAPSARVLWIHSAQCPPSEASLCWQLMSLQPPLQLTSCHLCSKTPARASLAASLLCRSPLYFLVSAVLQKLFPRLNSHHVSQT